MFGCKESDVLSKCHMLGNMTLSRFSQGNGFNLMENGILNIQWRYTCMKKQFSDEEICSQCHTIWSLKYNIVPWWCHHRITHYVVRFYCLLIRFVDVGNQHLIQLIHKRSHAINDFEECSTIDFNSNCGILTCFRKLDYWCLCGVRLYLQVLSYTTEI
jgi:hypothetical protein